jgi:hypothetical protein
MLLKPLLRLYQLQRVRTGRKDLADESVGIQGDRGNQRIHLFRRE